MSYKTPVAMLYQWEKTIPDSIYLKQPVAREFHDYTWKETANQVRRMAAYLKSLGYPEGTKIALMSKNCAHWVMADLAIMMAGYVSVPLYPNLTSETIRQILEHSESKLLFVGKLDGYAEMKSGIPEGVKCVSFPYSMYQTTKEYEDWDDIIAKTEPMSDNYDPPMGNLGTIIYTSGTTGVPKGVMHNFEQLSFTGYFTIKETDSGVNERFFSYLPLSHCAERLLCELGTLYCGGTIYFAENLDTFAEDLQRAKPTVFLAVPRIWTKFQDGILAKLPQKKLNILLNVPVVNGLIRKKIKVGLGLDQARLMVSGAAPIPKSMLYWYQKLDITILEAYGMTENMAYSHFTQPDSWKPGTVGKVWPGVETRISSEGEIQVKSKATMVGYYKEPDKTAEMLDGEYLKTGDQGEIDPDGTLRITGRIKDLFKTSKGKYVTPSPIELKFSASDAVECVCLVGSGLPQPVAVVTKSEVGKKMSESDLSKSLTDLMKTINSGLDAHERVSHIFVSNDDWTVENGVLTPTMKIKRNIVESKYGTKCEAIQADRERKVVSE